LFKRNGTYIAGAKLQSYTAKNAGTYTCKVMNSCGSATSAGKKVTITCKGLFNNANKLANTSLQVLSNPFSNSTINSFSIMQSQKIAVSIFDVSGRLVKVLADENMQAGTHQLTWNANDEKGNALSAAIYFVKMSAGNYVETKN
jgi:flagellar hook assembly protein FlgD